MAGLLDKYLESDTYNVVKARQQSEGEFSDSYFDGTSRAPNNVAPDEYQGQFGPREPGDKQVSLSQADDDTNGGWYDKAMMYHGTVVQNNAYSNYKGNLVHKYNQRDESTHYTEQCSDAIGVVRVAVDNEIL